MRAKARQEKDECDRNARSDSSKGNFEKKHKNLKEQENLFLQNSKESKRLIEQKTEDLANDVILNQALCQIFKEKYMPFGLEKNMPFELREFCGKLEGYFHELRIQLTSNQNGQTREIKNSKAEDAFYSLSKHFDA